MKLTSSVPCLGSAAPAAEMVSDEHQPSSESVSRANSLGLKPSRAGSSASSRCDSRCCMAAVLRCEARGALQESWWAQSWISHNGLLNSLAAVAASDVSGGVHFNGEVGGARSHLTRASPVWIKTSMETQCLVYCPHTWPLKHLHLFFASLFLKWKQHKR